MGGYIFQRSSALMIDNGGGGDDIAVYHITEAAKARIFQHGVMIYRVNNGVGVKKMAVGKLRPLQEILRGGHFL